MWYGITAVFIGIGLKLINKKIKKDPSYLPRISLIGAVVFVISVWHIPVPITGSSSHPVGTPLASIIIGPFATVVISAIALFFQTFVAHGGITTIGANTFSMGIIGAFGGYSTYLIFKKFTPLWFAAGIGGLIGSILTYLTTALQLAISLNPENVITYWQLYSLGFIPTQLPLALGEFGLTAYVIKYITETKKELIQKEDKFTKTAIIFMCLVTGIILINSYIGYLGGSELSGIDGSVEASAAPNIQPDGFGIQLMKKFGEPLGFAFVGIIGGLITGYFSYDLRRKRNV